MLSNHFLDKYKNHDPFKTLLQRSIYVGKYKRKEDLGWYDSVRRVVEGNATHDPNITVEECEFLYDTIFNGICTPAGRGLYTCGINMPSDAHYNCAVIPIDSFSSWSWVLKHSMLGVGVGTVYTDIDKFPYVSQRACALYIHSRKDHPNYNEVKSWDPDIACATNYVVEDSREGWCLALYYTVEGAFTGKSVNLDMSKIRERGAPLSTFDGTCSGYAPLVELCRAVHLIIRKRAGAKLRIIDCSDITNRTGVAAVMGNIRRTALNCIAPWNEEFLNAKINLSPEQAFRYTSNNSVGIYSKEDEDFVIRNSVGIAQRVINLGEPGFSNIYRSRLDNDFLVTGFNPCGESTLESYEFCCLAEIVLPNLIKSSDPSRRIKAITRFLLRERMNKHSCEKAEAVRVKNMRIGLGITGYTDVNLNGSELNSIYRVTRKTATDYSMDLGVNSPIKVSVVKPSGTVAKMFGVSPGGNSPWSKYMIQRMRLGVNEPLSYSFIEAGVPFEFAASDPTNQTLCFELPVHNESYSYAVTESAKDQLERQLFLQTNYTDQAVSATISFDPNKDDLSSLIKEFVPQLKASCFFPNNGGKHLQAPMEEITEEEFSKRYSAINHKHQLAHGDIQVDECKEGACLVR